MSGLALPVFFVVMFSLCYISAFHSPQPNHMPVILVGSTQETQAVVAKVAASNGGKFDFTETTDPNIAQSQVMSREVVGAIVLGDQAKTYVATAGGPTAATVVRGLAASLTPQGTTPEVVDLRPLPAGDPGGTSLFYFVIICTLAGYLTITVLSQAAPGLGIGGTIGFLAIMAVVAPVLVYLIGGVGFGAYSGSASAIWSMLGIGALYAFLIGLVAMDCTLLLGPGSIFAMLTIFVFINFPSSGGAIPASMLPSFWAFFNHFWAGASAVNAVRSVLYFDGSGAGQALLVLWAWAAAWLLLLVAPVAMRVKRRRAGALENAVAPL
ncbi:hypothetical protein [Kutzneria sp. NPDC052558]|uniref:hypothetical protein n=1 Tax=Kutzneria sp. NPDC052558 TaxID=3364121 RepID=UPI0037CA95A8